MRYSALLVAAVLAAAGCGGGDDDREPARAQPTRALHLFIYDRSAPLGFRDGGRVHRDGAVQVRDISYASPKGGRVPGYLVLPSGKGPFAAVILMHGAGGTREALLPQATDLARRGAVALTIDSPVARRDSRLFQTGLAAVYEERDLAVQNVVDLRRAVDLLASMRRVDEERIGYLGFSAGARTGAVLAGVEDRIKAYLLMSGGATPAERYVVGLPQGLRAQVLRLLRQTDPLRYVGHAAPARLFFQAGRYDEVVPAHALRGLIAAASEPKEVRWYAAGHVLNRRALADQFRWFARTLPIRAERR